MSVSQTALFSGCALGHFFLTSLIMLGNLLPVGYIVYSTVFFFGLCWVAANLESKEPVVMVFIVGVMAVLLDVAAISSYFPSEAKPATNNASMLFFSGLTLLQLFCRLVTMFLLCREYSYRGGDYKNLLPRNAADCCPKSPYEKIAKDCEQGNASRTSFGDTETLAGVDVQKFPLKNVSSTTDLGDVPVFPAACPTYQPVRMSRTGACNRCGLSRSCNTAEGGCFPDNTDWERTN